MKNKQKNGTDRIWTLVTGVANRNAAGWATPAICRCGLLHVLNPAIDGTIASTVPEPSWWNCSHSLGQNTTNRIWNGFASSNQNYAVAPLAVHCGDAGGITASGACCAEPKRILLSVIPPWLHTEVPWSLISSVTIKWTLSHDRCKRSFSHTITACANPNPNPNPVREDYRIGTLSKVNNIIYCKNDCLQSTTWQL